MPKNSVIIRYDQSRFPFIDMLETRIFKVRPLDALHERARQASRKRHPGAELGYQDNLAWRALMQNLPDGSPFLQLYHRFVREVIAPRYGKRVSYSNRPKMRVHLAGTPGVSAWHRDADITGRPDQVNAFLPFTRCFGGNALWCESEYGAADYCPIELEPGEVFLFDGGYLEHGTVANDTQLSRCSLDFRFAPMDAGLVRPPWSRVLNGRPERLGGDPFVRRETEE